MRPSLDRPLIDEKSGHLCPPRFYSALGHDGCPSACLSSAREVGQPHLLRCGGCRRQTRGLHHRARCTFCGQQRVTRSTVPSRPPETIHWFAARAAQFAAYGPSLLLSEPTNERGGRSSRRSSAPTDFGHDQPVFRLRPLDACAARTFREAATQRGLGDRRTITEPVPGRRNIVSASTRWRIHASVFRHRDSARSGNRSASGDHRHPACASQTSRLPTLSVEVDVESDRSAGRWP